MITIEVTGGIGNQMFQYALAVKMKYLEKNVCIKPMFSEYSARLYELNCFAGVRDGSIPVVDVGMIDDRKCIIRHIFKRMIPTYKDKIITYQPEVFKYKSVNLVGYWQNEKYFKDISHLIKKIYSFDEALLMRWHEFLNNSYGESIVLEHEDSVSVHIRRTDYDLAHNISVYGGICTIDYYRRAIDYCDKTIPNPVYYFFSDDMEWVKRVLVPTLGLSRCHSFRIIDANFHGSAFDLWLMTRCRHHIIANSTYSWWGAWLGDNDDKIVVAPSVWMNNYDDDIICDGWVRV